MFLVDRIEKPYLFGSDGTGRLYVKSMGDNSSARYIWQNPAGLWEIEDSGLPHALPAFPSRDEAALFAYMEGRFYHATITMKERSVYHRTITIIFRTEPERIQIRVYPNFGQRFGFRPGQWVASLYYEDGRRAGRDSCSYSIAETKTLGLRLATYDNTADADQLEWLEASEAPRL